MDNRRRDFLKAAGCSLLGAGALAPVLPRVAHATDHAASQRDGKRWALIIDTRKCLEKEGCNACANACHKAHNVPQIDEPEHEIKWIWKESYKHTFPTQVHSFTEAKLVDQPVLVLCNHCENAPCVKVCPTKATFKRDDGIVAMDMHRCIGCRYCMAACPYGSRSFNYKDPKPLVKNPTAFFPTRTKGVVEKCNFCTERLAQGMIPACVETCQKEGGSALIFGDLNDPHSGLAEMLRGRFNIRRKPFLGTEPNVFYLL